MGYDIRVEYGIDINLEELSSSKCFYDFIIENKDDILSNYEDAPYFVKWVEFVCENSFEKFKTNSKYLLVKALYSFLYDTQMFELEYIDYDSKYFTIIEQICGMYENPSGDFEDEDFNTEYDEDRDCEYHDTNSRGYPIIYNGYKPYQLNYDIQIEDGCISDLNKQVEEIDSKASFEKICLYLGQTQTKPKIQVYMDQQ